MSYLVLTLLLEPSIMFHLLKKNFRIDQRTLSFIVTFFSLLSDESPDFSPMLKKAKKRGFIILYGEYNQCLTYQLK